MSEILRTAWAVARSGWRANYNRTWRFSRTKTAAIFLAVQVVVVLLLSRRAGAVGAGRLSMGIEGLIVLMMTQLAWSGILRGFARGQFQLYRGILVPLFQMTPARPIGFLVGRVLEGATISLRNGVVWAWAYSAAVHGPARWPVALSMFLGGVLVDMLGQMAGLLLVATSSRLFPKSLDGGLFAGFGVTLALATWAVIYLAQGGTVADIALLVQHYRPLLFSAGAVVLGVPGALLLLATIFVPERVESLYQVGLWQVREAQEQRASRPQRSWWVPLPDGALRGILAKEWIGSLRALGTRIRLMMWLAVTVGVWFAGAAVRGQGLQRAVLLVGALVILAWAMAWGADVTGTFAAERVTQMLYRLAGVPAGTLVVSKGLAIWLPSLPVLLVPALVGGLRAGLSAGDLAALLLWGLAAMTAALVGGLGMGAATAGEEPDEPESLAGPRGPTGGPGGQGAQGSAVWALARNLALAVCPALVIWTGAGQPWTPFHLPLWLPLALAVLLPAACMGLGMVLMLQGWRAPQARVRGGAVRAAR